MSAPARLPAGTFAAVLLRLFAVQASWNYEILLGNGIAFSVEPALALLPGGRGGSAYRAAMARQTGYFNAHPYLAGVAVGALARAELDGDPPERIERFRTACCGPLGSVGDRLFWAGWLPFCSLLGILAFALGARPPAAVLTFLVIYNSGHIAIRIWGLRTGYRNGLRVASALSAPWLRGGPAHVARATALLAGFTLPLAIHAVGQRSPWATAGSNEILVGAAVAVGALVIVRLQGRVEGWRLAIGGLALLILFSVVR